MKLADRAENISPSITLAITAKAKEMQEKGINVIGFGAGEPDFDTPVNIKNAGIKAIEENFTRYTPAAGINPLKEAIAGKLLRDQGLNYQLNQIVVCSGAKHALYNIFQVLCNEGDEVIIPGPYWVSYTEQVKLAGGNPVIIPTDEKTGFKVTPEQLKESLTPKTKAVVINSPNNPTGAVYTKEELWNIAAALVEKDIFVISDEIYEKLIYDGLAHFSIANYSQEMKKKTILVNGVSKTYAMTGWRIGYVACEDKIAKAISALQSHSTSNPTSIAQIASVEALKGPQDTVEKMVVEFEKRRNYMVERLNNIPGINCRKPEGAFYVFPNIRGLVGKRINGKEIKDDLSLAEILLEEAKVAVVPGAGFGAEGYIRLSYATSMELITEGLDRIEAVLK
jgi:aspartate aminotransferase